MSEKGRGRERERKGESKRASESEKKEREEHGLQSRFTGKATDILPSNSKPPPHGYSLNSTLSRGICSGVFNGNSFEGCLNRRGSAEKNVGGVSSRPLQSGARTRPGVIVDLGGREERGRIYPSLIITNLPPDVILITFRFSSGNVPVRPLSSRVN